VAARGKAKYGTALSVTANPSFGLNRHPRKKAAVRYPNAEVNPEKQQSLGLSRKTDSRMSGKYANTQGVAKGL